MDGFSEKGQAVLEELADFLPGVHGGEGGQVQVEVGGVVLTEVVDVVGIEHLEVVVEILFNIDGHVWFVRRGWMGVLARVQ